MHLEFRPATSGDTHAAVPLLYSSGPTTFDYVFAHPARGTAGNFLSHAFSDGAGEFGHRTHTVALVDGQVVAVGASFSGSDSHRFALATARQLLAFYGLRHLPDVTRRALQLERVLEPPGADVHYLGHLGVAPDWRGQGIGGRLVEHLLEQGRTLGRTTAALDVSVTNPRAQALYERLGFTVTGERPSTLRSRTGSVPGHRRMERPM